VNGFLAQNLNKCHLTAIKNLNNSNFPCAQQKGKIVNRWKSGLKRSQPDHHYQPYAAGGND